MVWIMEKLVRINDQLDEQLHAGFYFYILTSLTRFTSNSQFIWAMALMLIGLFIPTILKFTSFEERAEKRIKDLRGEELDKIGRDLSKMLAICFLTVAYSVGYLLTNMTSFYLAFWHQETEAERLFKQVNGVENDPMCFADI